MKLDNTTGVAAGTDAFAVDFPVLVASLVATQSASATAAAHTHHHVGRAIRGCQEQAIVTLLQAKPGWRAAATALHGSFHPAIAGLVGANLS